MRRRAFIALLGGAAAAWPLAARAQKVKAPVRLGLVPLGSPSNAYDLSLVEAFRQGLRRVGLIEQQDIILDVVWTSGDPDQAVSEVLRRGAELLIPCGSSASVAAKRQTSIIPIVFLSVGDPIAMGLVESLPRPGRNATGFSDILADLSGKLVDLSRELSKPRTTVEYLWHTAWPDGQYDRSSSRATPCSLDYPADHVRTRDQPQDRQDAGPDNSAGCARDCRRGDRIERLFAAATHSRFWHLATFCCDASIRSVLEA
jgi:hypothetical protein